MVFVVERAEIQPEQRHAENRGSGFGRQALSATLHANQQHALRRIEITGSLAGKGGATLLQPQLDVAKAREIAAAREVVLEAQHPASVQQAVLGLSYFGNVASGDSAILKDRIARQSLGVRPRETAQVFYQQVECFRIYLDAGRMLHSIV